MKTRQRNSLNCLPGSWVSLIREFQAGVKFYKLLLPQTLDHFGPEPAITSCHSEVPLFGVSSFPLPLDSDHKSPNSWDRFCAKQPRNPDSLESKKPANSEKVSCPRRVGTGSWQASWVSALAVVCPGEGGQVILKHWHGATEHWTYKCALKLEIINQRSREVIRIQRTLLTQASRSTWPLHASVFSSAKCESFWFNQMVWEWDGIDIYRNALKSTKCNTKCKGFTQVVYMGT